MKSADQWIRTPLTTPHSWKVKRNIMQQRGLHLWELDMSWVSGKILGHMGETVKVFLRPFSSSCPLLSSAFLFLSWGWNRIWENYSISRIQTIPSQFVSGGSKVDRSYHLKRQNRCLTTNTSASKISAPPFPVYPAIRPATFPPAVS